MRRAAADGKRSANAQCESWWRSQNHMIYELQVQVKVTCFIAQGLVARIIESLSGFQDKCRTTKNGHRRSLNH